MDIFRTIADLLAQGESLALATIVSRSGSAPRAVGTRMVVRQDGTGVGTIGGGFLEAWVQSLAAAAFSHRQSVLRQYRLTARDASRMGLVCGGMVEILAQFLDAARTGNLELYREVATIGAAGERAWLITEIPPVSDVPMLTAQGLIRNDATVVGDLERDAATLLLRTGSGWPEAASCRGKRYLVEALGHQGIVYLFGAGHVSQQLAPLTRKVGFRTVVLDDRQEFANRQKFPDADEIVVLDSFDQALSGLEINADSYLVLVTRGHAHDLTVLRQALASGAGYIGMIGSRSKREAIYAALNQEGVSLQDLERVFSPIGVTIGAETPEEIAVSIVAELIRVRSEKHR